MMKSILFIIMIGFNAYSETKLHHDVEILHDNLESKSSFGSPPELPVLKANDVLQSVDGRFQQVVEPKRGLASIPAEPIDKNIVEKENINDAELKQSRDFAGAFQMNDIHSLVPEGVLGVQEQSLIANDLGFFPKTIFATRSVPLRLFITGTASEVLCIMSDEFGLRKQIKKNEIQEILIHPKEVGNFRIYCPINGMEGQIIVKE